MPPAEAANTLTWRENRPPRYATSNVRDPVTGAVVTTIVDDMGHGTIANLAISLSEVTTRQFRIHLGEAEVISLDTEISFSVEHHGSVLSTTIHGLVTSRPGGLLAEHSVKAREGNDIVFDRSWHGEF